MGSAGMVRAWARGVGGLMERRVVVQVAAPNTALRVLDRAIQVHGGAGVSADFPLAHLWASARTLRLADGPDEVHLGTIAKLELQRVSRL